MVGPCKRRKDTRAVIYPRLSRSNTLSRTSKSCSFLPGRLGNAGNQYVRDRHSIRDEAGRKLEFHYDVTHRHDLDFFSLDDVQGLTHIQASPSTLAKDQNDQQSARSEDYTLFFSNDDAANHAFTLITSALETATAALPNTLVLTAGYHWEAGIPDHSDHQLNSALGSLMFSVNKLSSGLYGTCTPSSHTAGEFYIEDALHASCEIVVKVEGRRMGFLEVFEHADIHLGFDILEEDMAERGRFHDPNLLEVHDYSQETDEEHGRRLGLFNWGKKVWSSVNSVIKSARQIKKMASEVVTAAASIAKHATNYALRGNSDIDAEVTVEVVNYNYDREKNAAVREIDLGQELDIPRPASISCSNCFAFASVGVYLRLKVSSNRLVYAKATLNGDAVFQFKMDASFEAVEKEWSKVIFEWPSPPYNFFIGPVPFNVQAKVPVKVGLEFEVKSEATFVAE